MDLGTSSEVKADLEYYTYCHGYMANVGRIMELGVRVDCLESRVVGDGKNDSHVE